MVGVLRLADEGSDVRLVEVERLLDLVLVLNGLVQPPSMEDDDAGLPYPEPTKEQQRRASKRREWDVDALDAMPWGVDRYITDTGAIAAGAVLHPVLHIATMEVRSP